MQSIRIFFVASLFMTSAADFAVCSEQVSHKELTDFIDGGYISFRGLAPPTVLSYGC
ncbi:MAG: hypothetical protein K2W94_01285 [Alphaproteobacteria bacterium]|nr:hypothetical protein [Alphaproteobacteria bacterium]